LDILSAPIWICWTIRGIFDRIWTGGCR